MKINIDFIKKNFAKSGDFLFHKFNEFQCRLSNFEDILFTARLYRINVFDWNCHAHDGKSDSTPRILNLIFRHVLQILFVLHTIFGIQNH